MTGLLDDEGQPYVHWCGVGQLRNLTKQQVISQAHDDIERVRELPPSEDYHHRLVHYDVVQTIYRLIDHLED